MFMQECEKKAITFGGWLRGQRKRAMLTQGGLARRVACAPITIRKLEAGERYASGQLAGLLADVLGVAPQSREAFEEFAGGGEMVLPIVLVEPKWGEMVRESGMGRRDEMDPRGLIRSSAAYLMDVKSERTLLAVEGQEKMPIASITKMLTALIAIEQADLQQRVTIRQETLDIVRAHKGYMAGLVAEDKMRLRDLLYAMMLPSGDDAALALAEGIGGSMGEFVKIMNMYAQKLKMRQSYFVNPSGTSYLTAQDRSPESWNAATAADLMNLSLYAMENPLFAQIVQTQRYTLPESGWHHRYEWETGNALLAEYAGSTGVKTGYTAEAGSCMVFAATDGRKQLMGVVLHGTYKKQRFMDARALLDWGFARYL